MSEAISEVDHKFFQDCVLPPLHRSINIGRLIAKLQEDKIIVDGRWKQFPADPRTYAEGSSMNEDYEELESSVFAGLSTLVADVTSVERIGIDAPKTLKYCNRPDDPPKCCFEKKHRQPDSLFTFSTTVRDSDDLYWRDLATPAEFRLTDTRSDLEDVRGNTSCYMVLTGN